MLPRILAGAAAGAGAGDIWGTVRDTGISDDELRQRSSPSRAQPRARADHLAGPEKDPAEAGSFCRQPADETYV